MSENRVTVIGAGLAGSEAAWQLANRGVAVDLYEMRPVMVFSLRFIHICRVIPNGSIC